MKNEAVTDDIYVLFLASALAFWAMVFLGVTLLGAGLLLGKKLGPLSRA